MEGSSKKARVYIKCLSIIRYIQTACGQFHNAVLTAASLIPDNQKHFSRMIDPRSRLFI